MPEPEYQRMTTQIEALAQSAQHQNFAVDNAKSLLEETRLLREQLNAFLNANRQAQLALRQLQTDKEGLEMSRRLCGNPAEQSTTPF